MFTMHTFDTGELMLSYAEGPDTGPPLVLLHGLTGGWQVHEPVMRAFAGHWHVYACDLRGHGDSGRAPRPGAYLLRDYARDIEAFVRGSLPDEEQVALIGFSLGAMIALGTAGALASRTRGVVLVEPALMLRNHRFREMPIAGLLELAYETTRKDPTFEELLATCRAVMPEADDAIILAVATQLSKIDPDVANPDVLDRGLEGFDLAAMLEAVTCPILLFHGEPTLGSLVQPEDLEWMRPLAPNAETFPIKGAGHDIPMNVVVEHGRRFLETVPAS